MPSGILKFIASIFAALIVLGIAFSYAYYLDSIEVSYEQAAIEASKSYATEANRAVESKCGAPVAIEKQPICAREIKNTAREHQRREHEVNSQRTDALWNSAMGKAAIIGIAIGLISIPLIFFTFWEARRAANAGFESNEIALKAIGLENRAWLKLEISTHVCYNKIEDAIIIGFETVVQNIGRSVASNIRLKTQFICTYLPQEGQPPTKEFRTSYIYSGQENSIFPNERKALQGGGNISGLDSSEPFQISMLVGVEYRLPFEDSDADKHVTEVPFTLQISDHENVFNKETAATLDLAAVIDTHSALAAEAMIT